MNRPGVSLRKRHKISSCSPGGMSPNSRLSTFAWGTPPTMALTISKLTGWPVALVTTGWAVLKRTSLAQPRPLFSISTRKSNSVQYSSGEGSS